MLGLFLVTAVVALCLVMVAAAIVIVAMFAVTGSVVRHMQGLGVFPRVPITGAEQKQRGAGGKRAESEEKPLFHGAIR